MQTIIGWGRVEFTVPTGTPLAGYEGGPPRLSTETHDPLYVRVITLEQGGRRICIASCDIVAVDEALSRRVAGRITHWGIDDFILTATHCHSGPAGLFERAGVFGDLVTFMAGEPDRNLINKLERCIMEAIRVSLQEMRPATLRAGVFPGKGIGTDRNDAKNPGDDKLSVLLFETDDGRQAIVYSVACHPTILHAGNTQVSADFPGAAASVLETAPVAIALFLNGSAGDVSTRFTRRATDFGEVGRLGSLLASQVRDVLGRLPRHVDNFELCAFSLPSNMMLRRAATVEEATQNLEKLKREYEAAKHSGMEAGQLRKLESYVEGAMHALVYSRYQPSDESLTLHVGFLRIGVHVLAFFPVELFSALSNSLRKPGSPELIPISYANGYYGYLTDAGIEHTDNYEKHTTLFAFGQGEKLMAEVDDFLRSKRNDG